MLLWSIFEWRCVECFSLGEGKKGDDVRCRFFVEPRMGMVICFGIVLFTQLFMWLASRAG